MPTLTTIYGQLRGNMGAILTEPVDDACLISYSASPRYQLPPQIVVKGLAGKHVLLTKSGARLDMIGIEHPALNVTLVEGRARWCTLSDAVWYARSGDLGSCPKQHYAAGTDE